MAWLLVALAVLIILVLLHVPWYIYIIAVCWGIISLLVKFVFSINLWQR